MLKLLTLCFHWSKLWLHNMLGTWKISMSITMTFHYNGKLKGSMKEIEFNQYVNMTLAVHNSQYYSIELLLSIHMKNKKNEKLPSRSRDYGLEVNEQTSHVKLIYFCFFVSLFSFPFFPFFGVTNANKILAHKQHEAST